MANTFLQGSASSAVGTSSPTFTFTYPSNTTAGSLLYFVFRSNTFVSVSVADNQGNSWVVQTTQNGGAVGYTEGYALNSKGGAVTVTLTFNANIGGLLGCWAEYLGPNAVRQSTVPNTTVAGGSPVAANSSAITYQVGDLVISDFVIQNGTSPSLTAPSGFVLREKQTFAAGYYAAIADNLNAASTPSPIAWGTITNDTSGIGAIAFFTQSLTPYSVPDSRVITSITPNSSRTVQATKIYDVQKAESRVAGAPVDCRIAPNIPVDSRVSPNIPQNSRTPGTFGPGQ
jgi:hypothetical protein